MDVLSLEPVDSNLRPLRLHQTLCQDTALPAIAEEGHVALPIGGGTTDKFK